MCAIVSSFYISRLYAPETNDRCENRKKLFFHIEQKCRYFAIGNKFQNIATKSIKYGKMDLGYCGLFSKAHILVISIFS